MEKNGSRKTGELFSQLALIIFKASGALNLEGDRLSKEFGLTSSRWKILVTIDKAETMPTVPHIARAMGQSRQTVQRLVNTMKKEGLLELIDNPHHKRIRFLALTPRGKTLYRRLGKKYILWVNQCAEDKRIEDLEITLRVMRKITDTINQ